MSKQFTGTQKCVGDDVADTVAWFAVMESARRSAVASGALPAGLSFTASGNGTATISGRRGLILRPSGHE